MSIKIQCDQCGAKRKVNERLAGRTIRCPGCETPISVPALAVEAEVVDDAESLSTPMEVEPSYIPDPVSEPSGTIDLQKTTAASRNGHASVSGSAANGAVANGTAGKASFGSPSDRGAAVMQPSTHHAGAATANPKPIVPKPVEEEPRSKSDEQDDDGVPPRQKREDGELDMTPMVDVTFLLLIFFMVTASFSLQKSIKMPRQSSDLPSMSNVEEETEELDPIELEINETGAFLVLAPEWERETPGKQNLTTALKEAIGDNRDGMKLDIKVHENAKLQMLVDGMDAGTIAGFTQIQVTEVDGFN